MPKIALEIKVNLENVNNLRPEGIDFRWYIKLKCSNCGEEPDHWQYVTAEERHDIDGSRGSANLVEKCKLCLRHNTLDIVPESLRSYSAAKNLTFQRMVVFDCRGVEPTDYDPRIGWAVEGAESGTPFKDVDLSQKEWCEYDEPASQAVGVYEWEHQFVHFHGK